MTGKAKNGAAAQPEQSKRFIEAAREAGCSEDEAVFDAALKKVVKASLCPQPRGITLPRSINSQKELIHG